MAQQVKRFGIFQTAKVMGILYALTGLVFLPFVVLFSLVSPRGAGFGIGFAVLLPVLYGVFGFICIAIGCAIYNVVAGMVGGIEVELDQAA